MKKLGLVIVLVIIVVAGYYFARPLFVDDVVDEALPVHQVSLEEMDSSLNMPSEESIASMSEAEKKEAEEKLFEDAKTMEVVVAEPMKEAAEVEPTENNPAPLENNLFPITLSQGQFKDADNFHKGSGVAKLIMIGEADTLVRLENFSVTNGPDLFVYLTKHKNPTSSSDVKEGFINLGRLKGNKGNQNYEVPNDIDLNEYNSVVIYCRAFSVLFSPASLS